jgi:hypothetical protein
MELMGYGLVILVFVGVFLSIAGKEKAYLERLVYIKQLRAQRAAEAKALRERLRAEESDVVMSAQSPQKTKASGP